MFVGVLAVMLGGCGGSERLPHGYSISDIAGTDVLFDPAGQSLILPSGMSLLVATRGVQGDIVYGTLTDGSRFLLDTARGELRCFDDKRSWIKALDAAGVGWAWQRVPGRWTAGHPAALPMVLVVGAVACFWFVCIEFSAANRRAIVAHYATACEVHGAEARIARCPRCSYDLSASRTGPCPECGKDIGEYIAGVIAPSALSRRTILCVVPAAILPNAMLAALLVNEWSVYFLGHGGLWELAAYTVCTLPAAGAWLLRLKAAGRFATPAVASRRAWRLVVLAWLWPVVYVASGAL